MTLKIRLAGLVNKALRPLGVQVVKSSSMTAKPWDSVFERWIEAGRASAKDPNDIGDEEWYLDPLSQALQTHYLPHVTTESVVLELGPGTGRLTRHLIRRCRKLILADYSELVCAWLGEYLKGKGRVEIHLIDGPTLTGIPDSSVDFAVANGVFEHVFLADLSLFLEETHRVLRTGGVLAFNFDNIASPGGLAWLWEQRSASGGRCIFRFYHPETVRLLTEAAGFETLQLTTSDARMAYIEVRKEQA